MLYVPESRNTTNARSNGGSSTTAYEQWRWQWQWQWQLQWHYD